MHHEIQEYSPHAMEEQGYDGMTSLSHPVDSYSQPVESFPISAQNSQQGDNYSMHSSPSPSPPSGVQPTGAGRQRSRSGTANLTMQQLNKKRQRATPDQLSILEEAFLVNNSPNAKMREMIADRIRMTERSVQIWFQNRRAKIKQLQKKEANGEVPDGQIFFGAIGATNGMMDHVKRNALMRSNSLGHGGAGFSALPPDIRNAMRIGHPNGPLTPASSPSNKHVISRLSIETLSIGPWHRIACTSMDLVCYFSAMEGRFTYYINNSSTGFKIEFPVAFIRSIKIEHVVRKKHNDGSFTPGRDDHRGCVMIELIQPPSFYSENRGTAGWQLCHDFTQGLVASTILTHALVGPYDALQAQMSELASMSPELASRLMMEEIPPFQYLPASEDDRSSVTSGDRGRRHSSAASTMPPPSRPASAIPAQFTRQHLTPGPAFNAGMGGPRVRQSFQAHRRTRSRSLPTSVNVSELALAASQHMNNNMVPGMKIGQAMPQYIPMTQEMLYSPSAPLRIDTSVADSTLDYYRQYTPSSNISSQMTPIDYTTSPASQVPLPSSLPFYEGNEYQNVGTNTYAHSVMYPTDNMETPTMYTEQVGQPMMGLDQFQPQDPFTYTDAAAMQDGTTHYAVVGDQQWPPQVTVTAQMDVDPKDIQKNHDGMDAKMEMNE